ncbi:hypothetical protein A3Y22_22465 [Salmonella enterica subsp. enterica serovar Reading]|nr:hypothetical protein [Salmonella enterica subsp. enterica serovar Reading]ECU6113995.1 hypothetical protein [Salmonella enterica subsp. enterica serovar Reading]
MKKFKGAHGVSVEDARRLLDKCRMENLKAKKSNQSPEVLGSLTALMYLSAGDCDGMDGFVGTDIKDDLLAVFIEGGLDAVRSYYESFFEDVNCYLLAFELGFYDKSKHKPWKTTCFPDDEWWVDAFRSGAALGVFKKSNVWHQRNSDAYLEAYFEGALSKNNFKVFGVESFLPPFLRWGNKGTNFDKSSLIIKNPLGFLDGMKERINIIISARENYIYQKNRHCHSDFSAFSKGAVFKENTVIGEYVAKKELVICAIASKVSDFPDGFGAEFNELADRKYLEAWESGYFSKPMPISSDEKITNIVAKAYQSGQSAFQFYSGWADGK